MPRCVKYSCSRNAPSNGAGGHLKGCPSTETRTLPAVEVGQRIAQPLGAGDRVVLEAARLEAGRRVHVVIGAQRHDEEVRVVGAGVGGDPPGGGVDAGHRLLAELDAVLVDVAVGQPHVVGRSPAEHHVELGVAEDERVVAVEQRDADRVLERLGEPRRQLQAAEARAEDQDVLLHLASTLSRSSDRGVFFDRPFAERRAVGLQAEKEVRTEGIQLWRADAWVLGHLPGGVRRSVPQAGRRACAPGPLPATRQPPTWRASLRAPTRRARVGRPRDRGRDDHVVRRAARAQARRAAPIRAISIPRNRLRDAVELACEGVPLIRQLGHSNPCAARRRSVSAVGISASACGGSADCQRRGTRLGWADRAMRSASLRRSPLWRPARIDEFVDFASSI